MKLNKLNSAIIPFYRVVILLMMALPTSAQNKIRLDSIVKSASNQMYINPDIVIKSGLIVLNRL